MLKILRHKKTAKRVWIGLALIIIPAFALWGFGGAFSRQDNQPLGRIFGRPVSALELRDSVSAVTTAAILQFGDKFPEVQKYLNLEASAWQRLILLAEAKKRGIKAADQEVIRAIETMPYFQYKGSFDNKMYEQTLQYVFRLKARAYEEQTRQNLILNKLYRQITDNLKVDDQEIRLEYEKANQEISVYYIASLVADFSKNINPTESQLKEYFTKNALLFKEPLASGAQEGAALVPEFDSAKEKVREAFVYSESVKKAEEKINQCARELKTSGFETAASKCAIKVKETSPFKFNSQIEGIGQANTFWEAAKHLKPEEASQIIRLPSGFYIIKAKSFSNINEDNFQKEKAGFSEKALEQKKEEVFSSFIADLNKKAR